MEKIWLSSPHMGGNEQRYVNEAFQENWIAPLGPNVNGFEADIRAYLGGDCEVAALTSGTGALHLALDILGVKAGDFVLVQSFTFCASVNPATYLGAKPVFIDSEEETWNMCSHSLEEAIITFRSRGLLSKIRAIIPVHLYGMPSNMDDIIRVSRKYSIPIVEDAAEALGSTWNGERAGRFGRFAVLSFNGNKIITTSGGGALVGQSADEIALARKLATQARDDAPHYQHSMIGYNYRLSNVCAGIGRGQMEVLNDRVAQRRANFERYKKIFSEINERGYDVRFQEEPAQAFSNRWLTAITIDPKRNQGKTREELRLFLDGQNIESRPLWKPMHMQPVYAEMDYFGSGVAERLFEIGLCLPSGSNLTEEEWDRIEAALNEFFQ